MLKRRPNSIDLTLTEVDLPSISGFALLTLIMEHDICKNIPVISNEHKSNWENTTIFFFFPFLLLFRIVHKISCFMQ